MDTRPIFGYALILQGLFGTAISATLGLTALAGLEFMLLITGIYLILKRPSAKANRQIQVRTPTLSPLGRSVLTRLSEKKTPNEIADLINVDPVEVEQKAANLREGGFITSDGRLTERGFGALNEKESSDIIGQS